MTSISFARVARIVLGVSMALAVSVAHGDARSIRAPLQVSDVPADVRSAFALSPRYARYVDAGGMPIVSTKATNAPALLEAAYIVRHMIGPREELLAALGRARVRLVIMATTEMTTDVPEHADLAPKAYWDRRARGVGPTRQRPAVSGAEENLLEIAGDPYWSENILVHEFAHAVHEMALDVVDPTFAVRLRAAYDNARRSGLWRGTYAMDNEREYWAEATQSWFDTNRSNDDQHGSVDTRAEVKTYDPTVAKLLREVWGDRPWRYVKPSLRAPEERAHLAGFDASRVPRFEFRDAAPTAATPAPAVQTAERRLTWRAGNVPATARGATPATTVRFVNRSTSPVTIDWIDWEGAPRRYQTLAPGSAYVQATYVDHVWRVTGARGAGVVLAAREPGLVEID